MKEAKPADLKRIACIILASGSSKRFGSNKLLALLQGRPLLSYILEASACLPCRLVTTRSQEVAELCRQQAVPCLLHHRPQLSDSIALGTQGALDSYGPGLQGLLFCPGDQPFLRPASLLRLCYDFLAAPGYIYRLAYGGQAGSPVLFPAALAPQLLHLPPGWGGAYLLKKQPELLRTTAAQAAKELVDIDTVADLEGCQA